MCCFLRSGLTEEPRWVWGDGEEMRCLWRAIAAHIYHAAVLALPLASLLKQTIWNINTIILQIYLAWWVMISPWRAAMPNKHSIAVWEWGYEEHHQMWSYTHTHTLSLCLICCVPECIFRFSLSFFEQRRSSAHWLWSVGLSVEGWGKNLELNELKDVVPSTWPCGWHQRHTHLHTHSSGGIGAEPGYNSQPDFILSSGNS